MKIRGFKFLNFKEKTGFVDAKGKPIRKDDTLLRSRDAYKGIVHKEFVTKSYKTVVNGKEIKTYSSIPTWYAGTIAIKTETNYSGTSYNLKTQSQAKGFIIE